MISDFPLAVGSTLAYLHYVGAWVGAMDPRFRLPTHPGIERRRSLADVLWLFCHLSPAGVAERIGDIFRQLSPQPNRSDGPFPGLPRTIREPSRVLAWLEAEPSESEGHPETLAFLRACIDLRLQRFDVAVDALRKLTSEAVELEFPHYRIGIRELASLRLAQAYDLQGLRARAVDTYSKLVGIARTPEIKQKARAGIQEPLQRMESSERLMLREYTETMLKYRR